MKVSVKKVDPLRRELRFEVPQDRVARTMEGVYEELGRVAKVKGFRPGKIPRQVLENEHGALAREETLKKVIPEAYRQGIEQENLAPLDLPDIVDVEFKDGIVKFTAKIDIKPDVKIQKYKGIAVKRKSSEVTEEELKKTMDFFKKSQGMKDEMVLDDSFAHGLGFPSFEDFKSSLSRQMQMDKDRQSRIDVENQVVNVLIKESKFVLPKGLVQKQLEHRMHHARERLESQGMPPEEIEKKEADLRKELKPAVEKDVKVYLILDKIAEIENIEVKENENLPSKVMEFLLKEAQWENVSK